MKTTAYIKKIGTYSIKHVEEAIKRGHMQFTAYLGFDEASLKEEDCYHCIDICIEDEFDDQGAIFTTLRFEEAYNLAKGILAMLESYRKFNEL